MDQTTIRWRAPPRPRMAKSARVSPGGHVWILALPGPHGWQRPCSLTTPGGGAFSPALEDQPPIGPLPHRGAGRLTHSRKAKPAGETTNLGNCHRQVSKFDHPSPAKISFTHLRKVLRSHGRPRVLQLQPSSGIYPLRHSGRNMKYEVNRWYADQSLLGCPAPPAAKASIRKLQSHALTEGHDTENQLALYFGRPTRVQI